MTRLTANSLLPGSEVAQIVSDAHRAAMNACATEDLCPWHPGGCPEDAARRELWLAAFAEYRNTWRLATAALVRGHPWRREISA